jgi:predicted RNase H-like HicB family nuclease
MNIDYTVQIWQEGDQFIAHAMPLDIMSAGATPQNARDALQEAVELFISTASEMGTLGDILEEAGYQRREGEWVSPTWIAVERHSTMASI